VTVMRLGIATDHGGFALKEELAKFGFEPDRVAAVARNLLGGG